MKTIDCLTDTPHAHNYLREATQNHNGDLTTSKPTLPVQSPLTPRLKPLHATATYIYKRWARPKPVQSSLTAHIQQRWAGAVPTTGDPPMGLDPTKLQIGLSPATFVALEARLPRRSAKGRIDE